MPQGDITLFLRSLRPINPLLAKRSYHKFYFTLERKFAEISLHVSVLDPWLESRQIEKLLSQLLVKANRFILTVDGWVEENLLEKWMSKDANTLWELVVKYVYKKRGLKFELPSDEFTGK